MEFSLSCLILIAIITDGMKHIHCSHLLVNSHGSSSPHIGVVGVAAAAPYPGGNPWGGVLNTSEAERAGRAGTARRSTRSQRPGQAEEGLV